uniref:Uncharacterized protein n=1 Tax=Tetradesmus obliquus TaxID=3088 RepID=A0A383VDS1_TETOB|eukprot:jgi/Sobl393_1/5680/SZX62919.1
MAGGRELLQAQDCQKLAGISVGGWITVSALAGMLLGTALTLAIQWYRRRKQLRYMDAAPLSSDYRAAAPLHQPASAVTALQMSSAAPLKPRLPAAPGAQPKYYSPLTKSMSFAAAGLHAQHSHGGSRMTEAGADTNGRGLQDQAHLTVSANNPFAAPAPQNSQPYVVAAAAAGPESAGALKQGLRASQHYDHVRQQPHLAGGASWLQGPQQSTSPTSSAEPAAEYQLPASVVARDGNSSMVSPTGSSPVEGHPAVPHVQQQQQWMQQQQHHHQQLPVSSGAAAAAKPGGHAAAVAAAVAAAAATVASSKPAADHAAAAGATGGAAAAAGLQAEPSAAESEIADEYEEADLDDDWRALLNDVDARLLAQGARAMDARERAVAIKKMLVATGTRGVDFAMHATVQEVLSFRRFRGN